MCNTISAPGATADPRQSGPESLRPPFLMASQTPSPPTSPSFFPMLQEAPPPSPGPGLQTPGSAARPAMAIPSPTWASPFLASIAAEKRFPTMPRTSPAGRALHRETHSFCPTDNTCLPAPGLPQPGGLSLCPSRSQPVLDQQHMLLTATQGEGQHRRPGLYL